MVRGRAAQAARADGPRHVDGERRVRRRARLRRLRPGPGPALRAPDRFHEEDAARADHDGRGGRGVVPRGAAPAAARSADLHPADVLRDARLRHAGAGVHDLRARGLRLADARAQGHGVLLLELPAPGAGRGADRRQGELPLSEHAARAGRGVRGAASTTRSRSMPRPTSPSWRRRTCGSPATASP